MSATRFSGRRSQARTAWCIASLTGGLILATARAEIVMYQGRLSVAGQPFEGVGRFKFALVDATGAPVWSSQPMQLQVSQGEYAARLGDSAQAPPIADSLLRGAARARLRIWFERKERGW